MSKLIPVFLLLLLALSGCGSGGGGASCTSSLECAAGEYCNIGDLSCIGEGECTSIPTGCEAEPLVNVCTCDGVTFFNACYAAQGGQSVRHDGECTL